MNLFLAYLINIKSNHVQNLTVFNSDPFFFLVAKSQIVSIDHTLCRLDNTSMWLFYIISKNPFGIRPNSD